MRSSRNLVLPAALAIAVAIGPLLSGCGDEGEAAPPPVVHPSEHVIPEWFTDAKFGVFIHWGVYSVPAWAPIAPSIYAEWYWFFQQLPIFQQYHYHRQTYGADFVYDDFIPQFRAENWDPADWIRSEGRAVLLAAGVLQPRAETGEHLRRPDAPALRILSAPAESLSRREARDPLHRPGAN